MNEYTENLNEEKNKLYVVKQKINLCIDLVMVRKV